jgi:predicted small metal-binding protein
MKKATCPPCGAEFKVEDTDELVEIVQRHAKTQHNKGLAREETLKAVEDA